MRSIRIDGKDYWLDAYLSEGERGKYFKLRAKPKSPQSAYMARLRGLRATIRSAIKVCRLKETHGQASLRLLRAWALGDLSHREKSVLMVITRAVRHWFASSQMLFTHSTLLRNSSWIRLFSLTIWNSMRCLAGIRVTRPRKRCTSLKAPSPSPITVPSMVLTVSLTVGRRSISRKSGMLLR